jgi:hypothetical protein
MEKWEEEARKLIDEVISTNVRTEPNVHDRAIVSLLNFIQKQKVIAKIQENHAWATYFGSEEVNNPDMVKHFAAMNVKLESLLTRFH